jgi:hypothetical protein
MRCLSLSLRMKEVVKTYTVLSSSFVAERKPADFSLLVKESFARHLPPAHPCPQLTSSQPQHRKHCLLSISPVVTNYQACVQTLAMLELSRARPARGAGLGTI